MATGTRMQQRRALETTWVTSNYILADGEIGVSKETGTIKIGDGSTHWVDLPIVFEAQFLPLHGKADDSALLNGVDPTNYLTAYQADTAATANMLVKRTSTGTAKAAAAAASDDLVQLSQLQAAGLVLSPRTVTAATTLALTDQNGMVFVNNSSLTNQVMVTIPPNSGTGSVAFPVGAVIEVISIGAGGAKVIPGSGVTMSGVVNGYPNYGGVRLIKTGTNSWIGISLNAHKRLPKIRALKTSGTSYTAGAVTLVPWNSIDSTIDFYNPDNEWFSIPASGLATARRIITNKDGEYMVETNFITTVSTAGSLYLYKLVADNDTTGGRMLCNIPITSTNQAMVRIRCAAGDSLGVAYQAPTGGASDQIDGTFDNRCNFTITRLSD